MTHPRLRPALFLSTFAVLAAAFLVVPSAALAGGPWTFTDVTLAAGFNYRHGFVGGLSEEPRMLSGGVASGDYDGDGWEDLYVVRGTIGPNLLFRNLGNGTFQEVGTAAGVNVMDEPGTGAVFGDMDGDGDLDIVTSGLEQITAPIVLRNLGNGTFENYTATSRLENIGRYTFSSSFGDIDSDGDLDLMVTFWNRGPGSAARTQMWRNDGTGIFTDVSRATFGDNTMLRANSFTPNWADINSDGHPDMLMAADFGTSYYALNDGDGTFTEGNTAVITDENGMGAAVGDFNNDGDLDWFVTSIWDPDGVADGNWGVTGNRLYDNDGAGNFTDITDAAGVRFGYWGWGACAADFNNDGHLDIFHVNGFPIFDIAGIGEEFQHDPSRMFVNDGDGSFTERSTELGVDDTDQGRGIVCFDYDHDGDIDIFVANNEQNPTLYRNDGGNDGAYLSLTLRATGANPFAIHARVTLTAGGVTQIRELSDGSNYLSQNPPGQAHFGLGTASQADSLTIRWPDGETNTLTNVGANQFLTLVQGTFGDPIFGDGFESGDLSAWSSTVLPLARTDSQWTFLD